MESRLGNGCKPFGLQVARATKFCTLAPNIIGSWLWNLFPVTLLELSIWICFLLGVFFHPWAWLLTKGWETVHGCEDGVSVRLQLKCDGTLWRTGGEVKGKLANVVGSHTLHTTSQHGVSSITTADTHTSAGSSQLNWRPPADLNGLVNFAERRNLVSARVSSSYCNWPLPSAAAVPDYEPS